MGRFDLAVLPFYKKKRGFLLELKVASKEEEMEHAAVQACEQIKEKQYLKGLRKKENNITTIKKIYYFALHNYHLLC